MDVLHSLMHGFSIFFTPYNLWMAVVGCFFGTLVGVLPGLGASATIALLIPFTFGMNATAAMIMICLPLLRVEIRGLHHLDPDQHPR